MKKYRCLLSALQNMFYRHTDQKGEKGPQKQTLNL